MNIAPVYRALYDLHLEALRRLTEPGIWEEFIYPRLLALAEQYPEARGALADISHDLWRRDHEFQTQGQRRGA